MEEQQGGGQEGKKGMRNAKGKCTRSARQGRAHLLGRGLGLRHIASWVCLMTTDLERSHRLFIS